MCIPIQIIVDILSLINCMELFMEKNVDYISSGLNISG